MKPNKPPLRQATARDLLMFAHPENWPLRPFLPLRRARDNSKDYELGLLYDACGTSGTYGYRCTVFLTNLFDLPPTEPEFLELPRLVYDTFDEMADDGWVVD
jgi:hypothetical protein